jgi:hypothetical protein
MFLCFAGDDGPHRRQGMEEGKKSIQIPPCFPVFLAVTREPIHCQWQWRWRVEQTRRHCSCDPKISNTIPKSKQLFPDNFLPLKCLFCNFLMLKCVFKLLLDYFVNM